MQYQHSTSSGTGKKYSTSTIPVCRHCKTSRVPVLYQDHTGPTPAPAQHRENAAEGECSVTANEGMLPTKPYRQISSCCRVDSAECPKGRRARTRKVGGIMNNRMRDVWAVERVPCLRTDTNPPCSLLSTWPGLAAGLVALSLASLTPSRKSSRLEVSAHCAHYRCTALASPPSSAPVGTARTRASSAPCSSASLLSPPTPATCARSLYHSVPPQTLTTWTTAIFRQLPMPAR